MTPSPSLTTLPDALAGYPEWLVVACATIVAVVFLWIVAKVLKWSLYLLMGLVLIGGVCATVWLLLSPSV